MKLTKDQRSKLIEEAMMLQWGSLITHLPLTHGTPHEIQGDAKFHRLCVREYAKTIEILSQLLVDGD